MINERCAERKTGLQDISYLSCIIHKFQQSPEKKADTEYRLYPGFQPERYDSEIRSGL